MPTILRDNTFFRSGVQELEEYLLSEELFWPLSGRRALPRLTIGGLLIAKKRLEVRTSSASAHQEFTRLEEQLKICISKWQAAWERKAAREIQPRFVEWKNYLEDYQQAPDVYAGDYPEQVQWRVVLHLLGKELPHLPNEFSSLHDLDKLLEAFFSPGQFVWDLDLAPAFPAVQYWYLYGKLKPSVK